MDVESEEQRALDVEISIKVTSGLNMKGAYATECRIVQKRKRAWNLLSHQQNTKTWNL